MVDKLYAEIAATACDEKKAQNITAIYIDKVSSIADWIIISEGLSDVQVRAIISSVENTLNTKTDLKLLNKEGIHDAKWALLDYGELIINVFQPKERNFYDLEKFWNNGEIFKYSTIDKLHKI